VPHPAQEVQAELDLAGEVRAGARSHLPGERRDALQQDRLGVAGGLDEVQVVPGVEPAAGRVDPHPGRVLGQAALEVAVAVDRRGPVGHRAGVVEMAGRAAQRGVDEVGTVPLVLVKVKRVGQRLGVEPRGRSDREPRRGGRGVTQDADPVPARRPDLGEPGGPHPAVALAPGAEVLPGQPGGGHPAGPGPDQDPAQSATGQIARRPGFGHDLGHLGRARRVADLIHPDRGGRCPGGLTVRAGGEDRPRGGFGADLGHRRPAGLPATRPGGGAGRAAQPRPGQRCPARCRPAEGRREAEGRGTRPGPRRTAPGSS
jgi:hypothetical protein